MKKMFFSLPVINRYMEKAGLKELENMKVLLEDEKNVRTVSRRARFLKSASFPTMKSFDDYDFRGIKFPKNFTKDEMLSLDFITKKHTIVFYGGCGSGKTHATIAHDIYDKYPTDGKYVLGNGKLIICQSNAKTEDLKRTYPNAVVNPLGDWVGGTDVDAGATNRKLGSDMAQSVSGYVLSMAQQDFEHIKFHFTSEF